jgi:hypothetical protein
MNKPLLAFLILPLSFFGIEAQTNVMKFDKQVHNFGKFVESVNPSTVLFQFVNDSKVPLVISEVVSSCGCTVPERSSDTIKPMGKGYIKVSYDSKNRIGEFEKSVEVFYRTDKNRSQSLKIMGEVLKPVKVKPSGMIPSYGSVTMGQTLLTSPLLYDNMEDTLRGRIFNNSDRTVNFKSKIELPKHVKLSIHEFSIAPFENKSFNVIIDGRLIKGYGFKKQGIMFTTDHPVTKNIGVEVRWIRKQFFPAMSARKLRKQPKYKVSKTLIDFGKYDDGLLRTDTITLTNTGCKKLVFHEIFPECPCVLVKYPKMVLNPNESMNMIVSFNPGGKYGDYTSSIWMVCNDPTNPESRIYVKNELPSANNKNCLSCPK